MRRFVIGCAVIYGAAAAAVFLLAVIETAAREVAEPEPVDAEPKTFTSNPSSVVVNFRRPA